jgi:hypothetical protein
LGQIFQRTGWEQAERYISRADKWLETAIAAVTAIPGSEK